MSTQDAKDFIAKWEIEQGESPSKWSRIKKMKDDYGKEVRQFRNAQGKEVWLVEDGV